MVVPNLYLPCEGWVDFRRLGSWLFRWLTLEAADDDRQLSTHTRLLLLLFFFFFGVEVTAREGLLEEVVCGRCRGG